MSEKDNKDIETMSFEQALGELETIVNNLERGDSSLEDSIRIYERGELLKHRCSILLKAAENRIETIQLSSDGTPSGTQAFDEE